MKKETAMERRLFLKLGLVGTGAALLGWDGVAEAVQTTMAKASIFPEPVYRRLGRTDLKITIVSFGAMLTPEPEVIRLAFENGVNYVDTARVYMGGRNEEIVAKALRGSRDKIYVATKTRSSSKNKDAIIRDVEASLKALETDYVDVIQLHNLTGRERVFIPETREALMSLRKQGKVRFFGVTAHTGQAEVLNALVEDKDRFFDMALVGYSFQSGPEVKEAIARAAGAGIGIVAMKTQAGGYKTDARGPIGPHQAALKWVLQDPHVTAAIPGMRNLAHFQEDISVMGMRFGFKDKLILDRYAAAIRPYYCHLCAACEPTCPRGVAISTINRCLMYRQGYGDLRLARATYRGIPLTISASACLDCSECKARCIHGLDIGWKMQRARALLA